MAIYDVLIIGSGAAGLAAAIYAQRAQLKAAVIEKNMVSGGQILDTYEIENYPGLPGLSGMDLAQKFRDHADQMGAEFIDDEVVDVSFDGEVKKVICSGGTYEAKTVVIATGAHHARLGAAGEDTHIGRGVSYCATCDGAFYKGKTTAVVGGGDVALEDAIYLARMCRKVYVIHRRDAFRGTKSLQTRLLAMENVEVVWDSVVEDIAGDPVVNTLHVVNKKTGEKRALAVDGVFIAVGIVPEAGLFQGKVETDAKGYIAAGEDGKTSADGVFAAGDVRTKPLRQVITAAADGANCITSVEHYLAN